MKEAKPPILMGEYGTLVGFIEGYPLVSDSRSGTTKAWRDLLGRKAIFDRHGDPVQGTVEAFARDRREGRKGTWFCVNCDEYVPNDTACDGCGREVDDE